MKAIFILLVGESKSLRDGRRAMLDLDADREVIGLSIECSEPAHRDPIAIHASRKPGRGDGLGS